MSGVVHLPTVSRRRVLQIGAGAVAASLAGIAPAAARQDEAREFTFVVAGLDYREGFDEHNSDVLMVSCVNLDLRTVRTVSIPRDLYVEIPGFGFDKITRAFHHGYYGAGEDWAAGARMLTDTITANFGLAIDGVVTTAFAGFVKVIDAVGEVEVDNPYEVVDPRFNVEEPGLWAWPEGPQVLDGESALRFVRTRNMDGDDGRVMRQQLVLAALLEELHKPEVVTELPELVDSLRDAVDTNIPMAMQARLIAAIPNISLENVHFTSITEYLVGGINASGMWVYEADWSVLPGVVQGRLAGE